MNKSYIKINIISIRFAFIEELVVIINKGNYCFFPETNQPLMHNKKWNKKTNFSYQCSIYSAQWLKIDRIFIYKHQALQILKLIHLVRSLVFHRRHIQV
jgi:hypothetical protein